MRKALIYCVTIFLILALLPVFAILISENEGREKNNYDNKKDKTTETETKSNANDVIYLALSYIDDGFSDEGIRASLAIAENNINYANNNQITLNIPEETEKNSNLEKKTRRLYKDLDVKISFNNENVYIPASTLSKGYTKTNTQYPYIKSVASPWDCFDEKFVYNKEYPAGISLRGLDYLCKNKMNYKEALKWYLPDFEIK